MKIAYVITRADAVGGASIHVRDLARAMRERGHDATVLVGGEGPVTAQLASAGVPYQSLRYLQRSIHPWKDYQAYRELVLSLREAEPDLVSTHTAKAGFVGRAAAAKLGIPAVYTPHGLSVSSRISPLLGPVFAAAERRAASWCEAIVCVSDSEKNLAIDHGIGMAGKLQVIHNGMPDVAKNVRANPSEQPPTICSVARFAPPKDHETLFRALAALLNYEWRLILIGDGPRLEEARQMVETLGLGERVEFMGYRLDPKEDLAASQIFVLSTRSEAFPRSILEAMRAGLPVVASEVGGIPEAVENKGSGYLVPPAEVAALRDALEKLIVDPSTRQLQGRVGRQIYETRFRFERMVERTLALYATVLKSPGTKELYV